ncbi:MAG: hypothetical protein RSE38_14510 [Acinetobacter sp.]
MFRRTFILCLITIVLLTSFAHADTHISANIMIPERFNSFFVSCGVHNEEELFDMAIKYMKISESEYAERYVKWRQNDPIKVQYGATTKELISNKKWDIAIVSSKDVDLQALADKKLIYYDEFGPWEPACRQCLLPEALVSILPNKDKPWAYLIHIFDYDPQRNDATLLIVNTKNNVESLVQEAVMDARPAELVRNLEGINRVKHWTIDQLIEKQENWDTAVLDLLVTDEQLPEELRRLDEAGLLYDLSQSNFLASRSDVKFKSDYRTMPKGIFSKDGRMVAIPYSPHYTYETEDEHHLFIVNKKSVYIENAIKYGELLVTMSEVKFRDGKTMTLDEVRKW